MRLRNRKAFWLALMVCSLWLPSSSNGEVSSPTSSRGGEAISTETQEALSRLSVLNQECEALRSEIEHLQSSLLTKEPGRNDSILTHQAIVRERNSQMRQNYEQLVALEQMEAELIRLEAERSECAQAILATVDYNATLDEKDPGTASFRNVNETIKRADSTLLREVN